MFKKIAALFVCVLMLCGIPALSAAADDAVTYTVQTVTADSAIKAGDEFTVTVSVSNVNALACIECKLRYDKTLMTAVSATKEGFLKDCIMSDSNIAPIAPETSEPNKYGEVWITGLADGDHAASGVLTTITFKANKDITADTAITIFKTPIAAQSNMTEYVCVTENGGVKITGTTPTTVIPDDTTGTTAAGDTVTTTAVGTVTTTAADTQTTETTAKQNSIGAPEGVMTPMETTTAATTQNGDATDGDNTAVIIVMIVVAVAAIATAVAVIVLKKKKS